MESLPSSCIVSSQYHVESSSFSPDGKLLAACFGDFTVRLLSLIAKPSSSGDDHAHPPSIRIHLYWVIKEHKSSVWCAHFSHDGDLLCTCSSDKTAKIWDVNSRILKRSFNLHRDTVWSCCFASANLSTKNLIATGSSDKTVKLWNTQSGELLHDLGGYTDAVDCLDFSSDGELLCTSCRNGVVKIWLNLWSNNHIASSASELYNTESVLKPIYLDLTAVNRSPSRFCMFSRFFSPHTRDCEAATVTDSSAVTTKLCTSKDHINNGKILPNTVSTDLFSRVDPNELLFAGGPENSIAAWSLKDIVNAFEHMQSEKVSQSSTKMHQDVSKRIPSSTCECPTEDDDKGVASDHVIDHSHCGSQDSDGKEKLTVMGQPTCSANVETSRTQLRTIFEEDDEDAQSSLTEKTDEKDTNSEITAASHESSGVNGEYSHVSDEPFSFYKVEPRWTLTDHLTTVWDCCTAALCSSGRRKLLEGEIDDDIDGPVRVLISCSGDRTLRVWKFENNLQSSPTLCCVKVFQMPDEHSESQILTCASCSTNQLLAVGLFNGSLHLANLSDLCSAIHSNTQQ